MAARTAGTIGLVALLLSVGTGYAALAPNGNAYGQGKATDLVITAMAIQSGPDNIALTASSLPSDRATAGIGTFLPGDAVVIAVTIRNIGSHPLQHLGSFLGIEVPSDGCSAGSGAAIVSTLPQNLPNGATATVLVELWAGAHVDACGSTPFLSLTLSVVGTFPH